MLIRFVLALLCGLVSIQLYTVSYTIMGRNELFSFDFQGIWLHIYSHIFRNHVTSFAHEDEEIGYSSPDDSDTTFLRLLRQ